MRRIAAVFALLCTVLPLRGESSGGPEETIYTSPNGDWALTVTPKDSDRLDFDCFRENPTPEEEAAALVSPNCAVGVLRKHGVQMAKWRLFNEFAPASAAVANDGTVVTFGSWYGMGGLDNDVVLYRNDGTLIAAYGLDAFLRREDLFHMKFSREVLGPDTPRIDEEKRQLILEVTFGGKVIHEVPVALEDGSILGPKPKLFPPSHAIVTAASSEVSRCASMLVLTGDELLAAATDVKPPAAYPEIAWKARISGAVVLDVIVRENGEVESVVVVKPMPFGLTEAAEKAAKTWRFRPFTRDGKPIQACGRVAVEFKL
jgi:TonB family protein